MSLKLGYSSTFWAKKIFSWSDAAIFSTEYVYSVFISAKMSVKKELQSKNNDDLASWARIEVQDNQERTIEINNGIYQYQV